MQHEQKRPARPVLFLGGGNMAGAIIRGGLRAGVIASHATVVAEPIEAKRRELSGMGVVVAPDAERGLESLRLVEAGTRSGATGALVLAVKPQMLDEVVRTTPALASVGTAERLVVSIMAGVGRGRLARTLAPTARVARVMPNLPIGVGKGMTAIAEDVAMPTEDVRWIERLFGAGGETVLLREEMMDAFTAVAGSGPAYLFYVAEAMERAAVGIGFEADTARRIVRQTLVGASALMDEGADPAALRAAVTSKGGTTHAACTALDESGVMAAFGRALTAARDRGRELGA